VASTRHKVSPAHALRARRLRTLRKKWSNVGPARVLRTGNLEIVDGKGRLRGVFGSGVQLGIVDEEGNYQARFGLGDDGQAHISVSAVPKDRGIRMTALPDGNISMLFTAESAPLIDLGLDEEEGKDPAAYLVLADKDGRAATALCGRRSGPFVRLIDSTAGRSAPPGAGGQRQAGAEPRGRGRLSCGIWWPP
jgi:hypothetical protein